MRAKPRTAGDGRQVPTRVIRFPPATMKTRVEIDSMEPIEVPADRYWGAQTERSRINFCIGEERMPRPLLRSSNARRRKVISNSVCSTHGAPGQS